ncbi:hypothetical protein EJB05_02493, partial [Eragrostis curvula]
MASDASATHELQTCILGGSRVRKCIQKNQHMKLYSKEEETIHHILAGCVFARQFWYALLQRVGLAALSPQLPDENFGAWWSKAADSHRNDCVFNGVSPNLSTALVMPGEEIRWWDMAGARALSLLTDQEGDIGD